MIALSKKADYALVALAYLGQMHRSSSQAESQAEGRTGDQAISAISARQIAERFQLPAALLMNILKDLARVRIVRSTRGVNGGYALAGDPTSVSLLDVVRAVDERQLPLTQCACDHDALPVLGQERCHLIDDCPIREPIQRLHRKLEGFLAEVSVADLIDSRVHVAAEELTVSRRQTPAIPQAVTT